MDKTYPIDVPSGSNQVVQIPMQAAVEQQDIDDVYKLTPHVSIAFTDTFKESSAIQGFPFMDKVNGAIYKYTHFFLYAVFTLIIGPFVAFAWAIWFAFMHIFVIWLIQPSIKVYFIWLRICNLCYEPALRLVLDPLFRSASLIYSSIKGQFKMNSSDFTLNMKTTQL